MSDTITGGRVPKKNFPLFTVLIGALALVFMLAAILSSVALGITNSQLRAAEQNASACKSQSNLYRQSLQVVVGEVSEFLTNPYYTPNLDQAQTDVERAKSIVCK